DARARRRVPVHEPSVAAIAHGLGNAYCLAGRQKDAEPRFREALRIARDRPGETGTIRLSSKNSLVQVLLQLGKVGEADLLAQELVPETEAQFGKDDPRSIVARETMNKVHIRAARLGEAIRSARDVLE